MCYSAMIEADLRELEKLFRVKIDWSSFDEAYKIRNEYSQAMIPSGLDSYIIQNAETPTQKRLAKMAKEHYKGEIEKFSTKLKKYEHDVKDFEAKLKSGSKAKDLAEKLEKRRATVEWHKEKIACLTKQRPCSFRFGDGTSGKCAMEQGIWVMSSIKSICIFSQVVC